ncbi:MAG: saccharopine dehydrogenase NADP-binding domain-containing protein [Sneathiella sp.]|nr:saccharopine dehydrogenase NADP-binding domain-containing protein [Sneathiella sp.]
MQSILILGGYGNFGKRIAQKLATDGYPVIIAGRNKAKAQTLVDDLQGSHHTLAAFDVNQDLAANLESLSPAVVINTCGPFQAADYRVAENCIKAGIPYIDLADGRDFVTGITALDALAKEKGTTVISGASTVPGLSSAVLEEYKAEFSHIRSMKFGISPGQKAERGLATTRGIMSYVGKKLQPFPNSGKQAYGWQDIYRQDYPGLGKRWMANCDIPDLDLLPPRYGIDQIRFSAGVELAPLHLGLWGLSWLVRIGLPLNLPKYSSLLLKASDLFDSFGTADGGMHVILEGTNHNNQPLKRSWFIIAKNGHGPYIPTIPAIILAKKIAAGDVLQSGAYPCVGLVTLQEYSAELKDKDIETTTSH